MEVEEDKPIASDKALQAVLDRITFDRSTLNFNWKFRHQSFVDAMVLPPRFGWLIWAEFDRPDIHTGQPGTGRGRDEIIWRGTTLSGVVKTCYVLVEMLIRHELMEGFRFDGVAPFNPHNTIPELVMPGKVRGDAPGVDTYQIGKART